MGNLESDGKIGVAIIAVDGAVTRGLGLDTAKANGPRRGSARIAATEPRSRRPNPIPSVHCSCSAASKSSDLTSHKHLQLTNSSRLFQERGRRVTLDREFKERGRGGGSGFGTGWLWLALPLVCQNKGARELEINIKSCYFFFFLILLLFIHFVLEEK